MLWQCHASGICCAFGRCYKRFHNRHDLLKTVATINSKTNNTSSTLLKCSKYIISFAEIQTLIRQSRRSGFKLRFSFRDPKISSTCSISYADEKRAACVKWWCALEHCGPTPSNLLKIPNNLGFGATENKMGSHPPIIFNDFQFRGGNLVGQQHGWPVHHMGSTHPRLNEPSYQWKSAFLLSRASTKIGSMQKPFASICGFASIVQVLHLPCSCWRIMSNTAHRTWVSHVKNMWAHVKFSIHSVKVSCLKP